MKNATLILSLVGAVLFGGFASAQTRAIFEVPNVIANVTFYGGNPTEGGVILAQRRINNSPFAQTVHGAEDTTYLTLEIEGQTYIVQTFPGGSDKYEIYLDINGVERENAVSLGQFLDEVANDPGTLEQLTPLAQN